MVSIVINLLSTLKAQSVKNPPYKEVATLDIPKYTQRESKIALYVSTIDK